MSLPLQGMGGQHGYFGLWIDVDFGKGHSKAKPTCTTYGSPQLSAQEDFQFQKMEVWAVGDAPKAEPVSVGALLLSLGLIPCTPFTPPPGDGFPRLVSSSRRWPEECLWVHSWAGSPVWDLGGGSPERTTPGRWGPRWTGAPLQAEEGLGSLPNPGFNNELLASLHCVTSQRWPPRVGGTQWGRGQSPCLLHFPCGISRAPSLL